MPKACYCKDTNTYSIKCCDGSLWAQGIGRTQATEPFFLLQEDSSLLLQEDNEKIVL
jgi:hypothetical protein